MNREEFEIIKGFGQRKWDYDKMENYLKENKFFRGIWADEIGLHPEDDFDRLIFNPYYMQLFQHGYAAGKTEQQKIIDELNLKLATKDDMITALNLTIDTLKAENPDVPCPAIHQDKFGYNCAICGTKCTVPLTKAQEYRISELEAEIERLHK